MICGKEKCLGLLAFSLGFAVFFFSFLLSVVVFFSPEASIHETLMEQMGLKPWLAFRSKLVISEENSGPMHPIVGTLIYL